MFLIKIYFKFLSNVTVEVTDTKNVLQDTQYARLTQGERLYTTRLFIMVDTYLSTKQLKMNSHTNILAS